MISALAMLVPALMLAFGLGYLKGRQKGRKEGFREGLFFLPPEMRRRQLKGLKKYYPGKDFKFRQKYGNI